MREIKFRAWHNKGDFMRYHTLTDLIHSEKVELMQFTGLRDSKGKEIYEGDIIENIDFNMICKVGFKNGAFTKSWENSNIHLLYDSMIEDEIMSDWQVIGNIYENKDLLED